MNRFTLAILLFGLAACGRRDSGPDDRTVPGQAELRALGTVPSFRLLERSGRRFGSKDLKGRVWVASFIFTRCQTICIPMCAELKKLQDEFAGEEDFAIVSTTVDPAYDTAPVLAEFAKRHEARPDRWYFLTGRKDAIRVFAYDGLKVPGDPDRILVHSDYLVLVDRDGTIRGYYSQSDRERMRKLRGDLRTLLAARP